MSDKEKKELVKIVRGEYRLTYMLIPIIVSVIILGIDIVAETTAGKINFTNSYEQMVYPIVFIFFIIIPLFFIYEIVKSIDVSMINAIKKGEYEEDITEIDDFYWGITEDYPDGHLYCQLVKTKEDVYYPVFKKYKTHNVTRAYLIKFSEEEQIIFCPKN